MEKQEKVPPNLKNFLDYYRELKILGSPEEFEAFSKVLLQELPVTFRLNTVHPDYPRVQKLIDEKFTRFERITYFDFPAYTFPVSKLDIRKNPDLKKYQEFLLAHTTHHTIIRQELVSMWPVALLSPGSEHRVLDMCASPGSKSLQILESLMKTPYPLYDSPGFLLSCELDPKRAAMLSHKTLFMGFPGYLVLNEDTCLLPRPKDKGFDRVLCDVPCSGDGTSRKNGIILKNWSYKFGVNLHGLQRRLLTKGLGLLEKGGVLLYSTCSLNPIENEAVVNSVMQENKGKIELIDLAAFLPEKLARPGINDWSVLTRVKKKDAWFKSFGEVPKEGRGNIRESMFGPGLLMERTRRIYPHLANTGGFFLAMIRKTVDFKPGEFECNDVVSGEIEKNAEKLENSKEEESKKEEVECLKLRDFKVIKPDIAKNIEEYYGFEKNTPLDLIFSVETVAEKFPKRIVLLNRGLRDFRAQNPEYQELTVYSCGLNAFKFIREEKLSIKYRVLSESLGQILPFLLSKRVLKLSPEDFQIMKALPRKNIEIESLSTDMRSLLAAFPQGPLIISTDSEFFPCHIIIWRGINHVNLLIKAQDIDFLDFRYSINQK